MRGLYHSPVGDDDALLTGIRLFVAFVTVAALVGIAIRRVAVPYSVALVAVGLVITFFVPGLEPALTPELVLVVLLPGLVFEASLNIDLAALRKSVGGVVLLAGPGVIIVAVVVALALHLGTGLPLELGIIVGSMVAATDPAAVIATFRKIGVPRRLAALTEGESLFNDGTGLVMYALTVSAVTTTVTAVDVAETLVVTVIVSAIIGLGVGFLASKLLAILDDHLLELTISVSAAYGTYLLADAFHESGVIATVIAGIVIGNYGRHTKEGTRAAEAMDTVWEFIAFLMTALVFLIVGLSITLEGMQNAIPWIVWGIVGTMVGRAVVVYGVLGGAWWFIRRHSWELGGTRAWLNVLFWSGLRGAVAIAMALSLPELMPQRQLMLEITFGIVLFTLVVQGMTIEPLVRRWLKNEPDTA